MTSAQSDFPNPFNFPSGDKVWQARLRPPFGKRQLSPVLPRVGGSDPFVIPYASATTGTDMPPLRKQASLRGVSERLHCAGPCSDKRGSGTSGGRGFKFGGLILSRTIRNRLALSTSGIAWILGKAVNSKELSLFWIDT